VGAPPRPSRPNTLNARGQSPKPHITAASSRGHCNTSASFSDGDIRLRVCRALPLTVCACWVVGQELDIRHSRIWVPSTRSDADAPDEDAHILHTAL